MNTKIAKACEPCRLRKKRCNGSHPCNHSDCQDAPETCVYRHRTRIRKPKRDNNSQPTSQLPLLGSNQSLERHSTSPWHESQAAGTADQGVQHEVYHSVTETHLSPSSIDSSQLFYGPSSYFAFLQQIHRGVLPATQHGQFNQTEARSGVDTFMQRSIFFGTPSRISPEAIRSDSIQLAPITKKIACKFLGSFKTTAHFRLPFYTTSELDGLLECLYNSQHVRNIPPQTKASFLVMLAIGALSTPDTDLAETLFTEARREAVILEDAVTLKTLQLSILFADYQVNMGRPNSTYLHLGVACRRAFALGLHIGSLYTRLDSLTLQSHQITIWSLYFYETYQALSLGRKSGLKITDIACPFPTEPLPLVRLCRIARIMEDAADAIYGRKATSLRQLYIVAEELRVRLYQFAQDCGIGSPRLDSDQDHLDCHESMALHSMYYHAIILIFRPFQVAKQAMRVNGGLSEVKDMWLRQACRHAVDAAQDSIEFSAHMGQICTAPRYQGFFIECSCAVLLYDILYQPSKYSYNMEYIEKAIQALSSMVSDEPIISSLNSIRRVLETIEASIPAHVHGKQPMVPESIPEGSHQYSRVQFPSLNPLEVNESGRMILLTDDIGNEDNRSHSFASGMQNTFADQDWTSAAHFNLDVMTTDLFNFFPLDMTTPMGPATGNSTDAS
ncbi:c6 zinc finger domain-containing [Fusarium longipes]|uniref:C6 zinc finger domain-containing n=1 Tax=Fusarium longipes TaxID=694270 RepID=A0A395SFS8_9HYPO|nr:c6 zinc finger domain-containing [Fusarium longipes]